MCIYKNSSQLIKGFHGEQMFVYFKKREKKINYDFAFLLLYYYLTEKIT